MDRYVVRSTRWWTRVGVVCVGVMMFIGPAMHASAEGSGQIGLNQGLADTQMAVDNGYAIDNDSASWFVDIVTAGEVINVSLCGLDNTDDLTIEIFDPIGASVSFTALTDSNVDCADSMTAPLTNPVRYTTLMTGAYRLELQNLEDTVFAASYFARYDISVTPDALTDPDPTIAAGRLWAYSWNFNAGTFTEADATDANYFALVPGGRPNTNYIWELDLNNMAGFGYNIIANDIGVDAPNSGYSTPTSMNSATYKFPVYTGVPAIANPLPAAPPSVANLRFIDDAGVDSSITPVTSGGTQDSGFFEFDSDVEGTYAVVIDIDRDGEFGDAGDLLILAPAVIGLNQVAWDGTDADGNVLPDGVYNAQITVRMGEYHFVANDVETSGGLVEDGLTIYLTDQAGNRTPTLVYWDDATLLSGPSGTSTLPDGELSGTPAGSHTWGDFDPGGGSFGNNRYLDTYVYGFSGSATTTATIASDDTLLTGVDGTVVATSEIRPGDTISITVTDNDLNTIAGVAERIVVGVTNPRTGELEQVELTETGVNSGEFSGTLVTVDTAAVDVNNNQSINTVLGDSLGVTYTDQIDAVGASVDRTATVFVRQDTDGDGIFDSADEDDDNDGLTDAVEGVGDSDGDGLIDSRDIDSDNDGIVDNVEAQTDAAYLAPLNADTDMDGLDDRYDTDDGGVAIVVANTDGADLPDYLDDDSDNDGVPDRIEGHDGNADGVADVVILDIANDADADGLNDVFDTIALPAAGNANGSNSSLQNSDGADNRDWRDTDDDNDATPTSAEDGNSNGNFADDNTDGDGVPDYLESSIADSDGDGTPDQTDPDDADPCTPTQFGAGCTVDTDGDGAPDSVEGATPDTDGDGTPDYQESSITDFDMDGTSDQADPANTDPCIPSALSVNCATDTDGDGLRDGLEALLGTDPNNPDTDEDGISDGVETGGDAVVSIDETDPLDRDSDDDGLLDGAEDSNANGVVDAGETDAADGDTDGDGLRDGLELGVVQPIADPDGNGPLKGTDGLASFRSDVNPATTTDPLNIDTDGDGIADGVEDANRDGDTLNVIGGTGGRSSSGETDPNRADTDGDGLIDSDEINGSGPQAGLGATDPLDRDTDDGGALDGAEVLTDRTNPSAGNGADDLVDSDGDGLSDALEAVLGTDPDDPDTDNDGLDDGLETGFDGTLDAGDTNPLDADTDDDGLNDGTEVGGLGPLAGFGPTDPNLADTDGDGINDGVEAGVSTNGARGGVSDAAGIPYDGTDAGFVGDADPRTTTDPTDRDSDNDGLDDGAEDTNQDGETNSVIGDSSSAGSGETDPNDADSDNDGLTDGDEVNATGPQSAFGATDPLDSDTDDGGVLDGTEVIRAGTNPIAGNAADDAATDSDGDGVSDADEALLGTDPNDADSDDDGIGDGEEIGFDGMINFDDSDPLDADSDDDGLNDGRERLGADGLPGSGDETDPLSADSDNDGIADGTESGITTPVDGGVSDGNGTAFGGTDTGAGGFVIDADPATTTDPTDPDSDNDGLLDGLEDQNADGATMNTLGGSGSAGTGETDPNDPDTDRDGLLDGDEALGIGPLAALGVSDPLDSDTDDGGMQDGSEVFIDGTNPTAGSGADDVGPDSDNDGLSDATELLLGTDPNDPDSDDDGIEDGHELGNDGRQDPGDTHPLDSDSDDDGLADGAEVLGPDGLPGSGDETDPASADSDNDGLSDGLERGVTTPLGGGSSAGGTTFAGTDPTAPGFAVDTDPTTTTDPTNPDSDADGLNDGVEDANADGSASMTIIGGTGTAGSGETDPANPDTDGDGLRDGNEAGGSGILSAVGATDPLDTDTDDGGIDDGTEVTIDGTNPTAGNRADDLYTGPLDLDNDGTPDDMDSAPSDPCVPSDTVSACDTDGDGVPDGIETLNGTDPTDSDTDNDGIPDGVENTDSDGDGINDGADNDSDNDGIADADEAGPDPANPVDTDNDGTPDVQDNDSDGDGIPDALEGGADSDGDGIPNFRDLDSDDDGLPDSVELRVTVRGDADNDGIDDAFDVDATGGTDANGDGVDDATGPTDTDGDGNADFVDLDADNDGIPDTVEADLDPLADGDGDGVNDRFDVDLTLGTDANGDGVDDAVSATDTDTDGVPDYLDLDSDNDSLLDVIEAGGADTDGNGIVDEPQINQATLTQPVDTDADGTADFRELDSNKDGRFDIADARFPSLDGNADGLIDALFDGDGDGIPDVADSFDGFGTAADTDRDGLLDSIEGMNDTDGDGLADFADTDSDNDGIDDAIEAVDFANPVDTDGDGTPDFQDSDSDNDGIDDVLEGNNDFNNNGVPDYREREGQLQTALEGFGGGGALAPLMLLLLLGVCVRRRLRGVATLSVALLALGVVVVPSAHAADDCDAGSDYAWSQCWYAGIGLGYSYVSPDQQAQNFVHDAGENHAGGLGLFVGKRFSAHWFAELRYADLGEAGLVNLNPAVNAAFPDAAIDYSVPSIMGGYRFWPERSLNPFVKAGVSFIRNSASGAPIDFDKQTGVQVAFGGGVDYQLPGSAWFVRGDIDWYDRDAWFAGLYVGRSFGWGDRQAAPTVVETPRSTADQPRVATPVVEPEPAPVQLADSDFDSVVDADDRCPGTAAGVSVDPTGCPESLDYDWPTVRFGYKSDDLTPESIDKLNAAARWLIDHPSVTVELGGHTDTVGGQRYNQPLSARRAAQVLDYLVNRGVSRSRLSSVGYGQTQPIADNATEQGRALNRRVELRRSNETGYRRTSSAAPAAVVAADELPVVRFGYKSNDLDGPSRAALDALAGRLAASPNARILVAGYTDSIGGVAYNTRLSQRRAQMVADYLTARGVRTAQIDVLGYGPADPMATNATEQGRALNRRVELSWR